MKKLLIKRRPTTLKSVCSIILVVAVVMCFSVPFFAANPRLNAANVSFFTGGSGNTYVDGSANGKY